MTQEQYDIAKDIVLDLLGWGVPPDYLLDCGLSRQIVYYVFTELNLRLPSNLETSDLVPYPTPEVLALVPASPSLSTRSHRSLSAAMPPPSSGGSFGDRSVPDQADSTMSSPSRSPKVKIEPTSPSRGDLSLFAIEQQRRQELLARKAAIASRRTRHGDHMSDRDLGYVTIPTQFVDDFLKTIESARPTSPDEGDPGTPRMRGPESMDVDEPIPRLMDSPKDAFPPGPPSPRTASSDSTGTGANSPTTDAPGLSEPLKDTECRDRPSASRASPDMVVDEPVLNKQASLDTDGGNPYRRGSKRPVAADFVDFDFGPGASRSHMGGGHSFTGYANGGSQLLRRKTGSFAGVSGMRRCVIELSDSEEDGDGKLLGYSANGNGREYSPAAHPSRPAPTVTPPITSSSGSGGTSTSTGAVPWALMAKEEEIKKMRQLIAEREEMRSRKLAAMSGKLAPVHAGAEAIKQEATSPRLGDAEARRAITNAIEEHGP